MNDLDRNLIRSFVAVAEEGSLSAAARRLVASQPTLGRHVAELEAALGITLFRRGQRGYELTTAGATLYQRARAVEDEVAAFGRVAAGSAERVAGTVRITASAIVSAYVLPPILARLAVVEPEIDVEIVASDTVQNLLRRDADIAIRMVEPRQIDLVARKIADLPLAACAATDYLDRRGRPQTLDDLAGHDLIGYDRETHLIDGFRALGIAVGRERFRFRSDNQIVLWEAVRTGNGIGFAQRSLVERDPLVEAVMPGLPLPGLPMWLAMHRDVRNSPRIRRMSELLHTELARYAA